MDADDHPPARGNGDEPPIVLYVRTRPTWSRIHPDIIEHAGPADQLRALLGVLAATGTVGCILWLGLAPWGDVGVFVSACLFWGVLLGRPAVLPTALTGFVLLAFTTAIPEPDAFGPDQVRLVLIEFAGGLAAAAAGARIHRQIRDQ